MVRDGRFRLVDYVRRVWRAWLETPRPGLEKAGRSVYIALFIPPPALAGAGLAWLFDADASLWQRLGGVGLDVVAFAWLNLDIAYLSRPVSEAGS